jgi:hypothetical protein
MSARAQTVINIAGGKFCHAELQFAGTVAPACVVPLVGSDQRAIVTSS